MTIGDTLDVYRRDSEGVLGRVVGQATLLQPDLAQILPPLDRTLADSADHSVSFAVKAPGTAHPVDARDFYVGTVSPEEGARIIEQDCPSLKLVPNTSALVFLGLTTPLARMASQQQGREQGSLCRIVCLWFCTDC